MNESLEHFRELIREGKKKGRLILPLSNWSQLQVTFTRDPATKWYILQVYENKTWLFTTYDKSTRAIVRDFDELINNYLY